MYRWEFDDGAGEHYIVPTNPNTMTKLKAARSLSTKVTTAVGGQTLLFEGRRPPQTNWQFGGVILTKEHYDALDHWTYTKGRITITDHYRRVLTVVLTDFDPKPKRSIGKPWRHDYTVTGTVIDVDSRNAVQVPQ